MKPYFGFETVNRLWQASDRSIANLLRNEDAATAALVLLHLPPARAAAVLDSLESSRRVQAVRAALARRAFPEEIVKAAERRIGPRLEEVPVMDQGDSRFGRVSTILASVDRGTSEAVLDSLRASAAPIYCHLRSAVVRGRGGRGDFMFGDLIRLSDSTLVAVLRRVDPRTLALALKDRSTEFRRRINRALPLEEAARLKRELFAISAVRLTDVVHAQQSVLAAVADVLDTGSFEFEGETAGSSTIRMLLGS